MDKDEAKRFDWVKARRSDHSLVGGCVEVGRDAWTRAIAAGDGPGALEIGDTDGRCGMVPLRDSHNREQVIWVPRRDFQIFLLGVKDGDFDDFLAPEPLPPGVVPVPPLPPGLETLAAT